jgi:hypothetical protein
MCAALTPRRISLFLGNRLMAGRQFLALAIKVRILVPQPAQRKRRAHLNLIFAPNQQETQDQQFLNGPIV